MSNRMKRVDKYLDPRFIKVLPPPSLQERDLNTYYLPLLNSF